MQFPTFPADQHKGIVVRADYFRYATIGLALERLRQEKVPGGLAEAGVWRGEMSRFIRAGAPERTYYLFDTFSGFPDSDLGDLPPDKRFRDTNVETVLAKLGDTERVVVREGRVPETFAGLEQERFSFVLLDLDLHDPTLSGLEFFYPRLTPGGYLIVHDYNNPESDWGCRRALDSFIEDKPERIVEIADVWGTALFRKH